MNINIKNIVASLEELCANHRQVNSYYHGDFVEVLKEKEIIYTTVITTTISAVINPNDITVTMQMLVLDKILKDKKNYLEVESNTMSILGDLVNFIQSNDDKFRYARLSSQPSATKIEDNAFDVVDGWKCNLNFKLKKSNGICEVPIN